MNWSRLALNVLIPILVNGAGCGRLGTVDRELSREVVSTLYIDIDISHAVVSAIRQSYGTMSTIMISNSFVVQAVKRDVSNADAYRFVSSRATGITRTHSNTARFKMAEASCGHEASTTISAAVESKVRFIPSLSHILCTSTQHHAIQ
jgi:hypothetical protein